MNIWNMMPIVIYLIYNISYLDDFFNDELSDLSLECRHHECGVDSYVNANILFNEKVGIVECAIDHKKERCVIFNGEKGKMILKPLHRPLNIKVIINNKTVIDEDIAYEYDDFYSTMMLGVVPQRTCLSYKDGMYNRCLLACFDSNKKVLYAKINGRVVARAMIRLTKGKYNNEERTETSLAFIDLEDIPIDKPKVSTKEEYLTLFLERPYIAGITDKEEKQVKELFIKLLEKKATDMNAILVLSSRYSNIELENYVVTKYYMYISKSKAGCQYLDSLNGSAGISDEGQYKANNFLIWKLKEYNKSIKENIF